MPTRQTPTTIVWFHRDLRLRDHPALRAAAARGAVLPVFLWCPGEEAPWAPGAASRWWLHHSLVALKQDLSARGLPLVLRKARNSAAALLSIAQAAGATSVYWNRRYEPALRRRDAELERLLQAKGIAVQTFPGDVLFEPSDVLNQAQKPFQVFTPYWNHCLELPPPPKPLPAPKHLQASARAPCGDALASLGLLPKSDWAQAFTRYWTPGEASARRQLKRFVAKALEDYPRGRDLPDRDGTSRLSAHLHFGEISAREVWHEAPGFIYRKEIGWRDFARTILFHFPETQDEPLRPEFRRFRWLESPHLQAWKEGRTGYPIVDAGMRELWSTGWMHNRVRMVVASFLVKDLLASWKEGALWFWETLVDADLASNSFNWQWAGGCGADAAPYFRVFNPIMQGERFDAAGAYVRRWVPELQALPDAWIHKPWQAPAAILERAGVRIGTTYPAPVIDHGFARARALDHFSRLKGSR